MVTELLVQDVSWSLGGCLYHGLKWRLRDGKRGERESYVGQGNTYYGTTISRNKNVNLECERVGIDIQVTQTPQLPRRQRNTYRHATRDIPHTGGKHMIET